MGFLLSQSNLIFPGVTTGIVFVFKMIQLIETVFYSFSSKGVSAPTSKISSRDFSLEDPVQTLPVTAESTGEFFSHKHALTYYHWFKNIYF